MIILDYSKQNHKKIIQACVKALQAGKTVVYPTDTSYGLAADISNKAALKKLYKIKERDFNKPVHVVVPNKKYAEKVSLFDIRARKLALKFWPGALTLVLPLKGNNKVLKLLSAGTGTVGLRMPNNNIALDLASVLKSPITATGANPSFHLSGGFDSYSAEDVIKQFQNKKYRPDIIINAGKLSKRKPSTLVKLTPDGFEILRPGPISLKQIKMAL
jgi:L-threonylcarbamoyladenylate synthase